MGICNTFQTIVSGLGNFLRMISTREINCLEITIKGRRDFILFVLIKFNFYSVNNIQYTDEII